MILALYYLPSASSLLANGVEVSIDDCHHRRGVGGDDRGCGGGGEATGVTGDNLI